MPRLPEVSKRAFSPDDPPMSNLITPAVPLHAATPVRITIVPLWPLVPTASPVARVIAPLVGISLVELPPAPVVKVIAPPLPASVEPFVPPVPVVREKAPPMPVLAAPLPVAIVIAAPLRALPLELPAVITIGPPLPWLPVVQVSAARVIPRSVALVAPRT